MALYSKGEDNVQFTGAMAPQLNIEETIMTDKCKYRQDTKHPRETPCYVKLPPIKQEDLFMGCMNCSNACLDAPMDMVIAVGFGIACATKDDIPVYEEGRNDGVYLTVGDIEKMAQGDPCHDWRIKKHGPLHGETFQRQGNKKWVCIESNQGFA